MALRHDILTILTSYHEGYQIMRRGITNPYGLPFFELKKRTELRAPTLSVTLSRLKKNGLVMQSGGSWSITTRGKKFLDEHPLPIPYPEHTKKVAPKSQKERGMIVAFDIPEQHRKKRDWLRRELVGLGFTKIQKSFWYGPAPLSKDFIRSLHALDLLSHLKFFNAREEEIV